MNKPLIVLLCLKKMFSGFSELSFASTCLIIASLVIFRVKLKINDPETCDVKYSVKQGGICTPKTRFSRVNIAHKNLSVAFILAAPG